LYLDYEKEIRMEEPFLIAMEFLAAFPDLPANQTKTTAPATAKLAFIESSDRTDVMSIEYELCGQKNGDGITKVGMINRRQGWGVE
jgi:hypothetical protein